MEFKEFYDGYIAGVKKNLDMLKEEDVHKIVNLVIDAHKNDKQVFIFGNGGSASTSSHFVCDLGKGSVKDFNDIEERRIRVISLNDNIALMTAYGNDLSYEDIFAQQLANSVNEGDVVIAISASGNSPNIVKAISLAKEKKAVTIGLCGFKGGRLKELCDHFVHVDEEHYGIVEDLHLIIAHIICYFIKQR